MCVFCCFTGTQFFVTPWTIACQTPLSMGFSRQGYRSGCHAFLQGIFPTQGSSPVPFASPTLAGGFFATSATYWNESEKKSESEVAQTCQILCEDPKDCSLPDSSTHGIFQARILELVAISFPRGLFPTQGSNPGLKHRRQTLYYLSHQECPLLEYTLTNEIITFTSKKIPSSPVFLPPSPPHVIHPRAARS